MTRDEALLWGRGNTKRLTTMTIPRSVRILVTERQGLLCGYCGAKGYDLPQGTGLELDHKMPLREGGDNNHLNLMWACTSCNRGRGARKGFANTPAWRRREKR